MAAPAESREDESCRAPVVDYERLEDHGCLARHSVCIDQASACLKLPHPVMHWEQLMCTYTRLLTHRAARFQHDGQ